MTDNIYQKEDVKSRSSLVLIEIIIVIFFFVITCATCIVMFVNAHKYSEKSKIITRANLICENAAQIYTAAGGNMEIMADEFENYCIKIEENSVYSGTIILCYDKNFDIISNPAEDTKKTIENCYYEIIIHSDLEDANEVYGDVLNGIFIGYGARLNIYCVDVSKEDTILQNDEFDEDDIFYSLSTDVYLGEKDI